MRFNSYNYIFGNSQGLTCIFLKIYQKEETLETSKGKEVLSFLFDNN